MQKIARTIPVVSIILLAGVAALFLGRDSSADAQTGSKEPALGYRGTLLVQMRVSDLDRAVTFYRDTLGFEVRLRSDSLKWAELTFGIPGVAVGLGAGAEVKGSGSVSLNIGVEDVDAARRTLESRGVTFSGDTMTVPDKVKLAEFSDPDGNRIRLAQSLAVGIETGKADSDRE